MPLLFADSIALSSNCNNLTRALCTSGRCAACGMELRRTKASMRALRSGEAKLATKAGMDDGVCAASATPQSNNRYRHFFGLDILSPSLIGPAIRKGHEPGIRALRQVVSAGASPHVRARSRRWLRVQGRQYL